MKLLIVSGLSGSGKSIALNVLEDLDYYCIDNLPIGMLPALANEFLNSSATTDTRIAVGIDARNISGDLKEFQNTLAELTANSIQCTVFYLEATNATLIKRFSETRRKHPLSKTDTPLREAIMEERVLLEPVTSCADLVFDTTHTNVHQLRELIKERILASSDTSLSLLIESFGFKHGVPINADYVFDVRCLINPHWIPELRAQTGKDQAVIDFLSTNHDVNTMFDDIKTYLDKWIPKFIAENRSYMTIAIGCTGGHHRSVYLTEQLAKYFIQQYPDLLVRHRELQ